MHALLYQRHDGQSQGRPLRTPVDDAARDGGGRARGVRPVVARGRAADRPDVPCRRLGPALRGRAGGGGVRLLLRQRPRGLVRTDEPRARDAFGRGADGVARHVPAYRRDRRRAAVPETGQHRRVGSAARDDRSVDGDGRPCRASVGHDGDVAGRHRRLAARRLGRDEPGCAARSRVQAGADPVRHRTAGDRRSTAPLSRATGCRRAGCWCAGPGW